MGEGVHLLPFFEQYGAARLVTVTLVRAVTSARVGTVPSLSFCATGHNWSARKSREVWGMQGWGMLGDLVTKDTERCNSSMLSLPKIIGKVHSQASKIPVAGTGSVEWGTTCGQSRPGFEHFVDWESRKQWVQLSIWCLWGSRPVLLWESSLSFSKSGDQWNRESSGKLPVSQPMENP